MMLTTRVKIAYKSEYRNITKIPSDDLSAIIPRIRIPTTTPRTPIELKIPYAAALLSFEVKLVIKEYIHTV